MLTIRTKKFPTHRRAEQRPLRHTSWRACVRTGPCNDLSIKRQPRQLSIYLCLYVPLVQIIQLLRRLEAIITHSVDLPHCLCQAVCVCLHVCLSVCWYFCLFVGFSVGKYSWHSVLCHLFICLLFIYLFTLCIIFNFLFIYFL